MDILVSSNLERLLHDLAGGNSREVKDLMEALANEGKYEVSPEIKKGLIGFLSGYAEEDETLDAVKRMYRNHGYLMDTHTAVAYKVYEDYKRNSCDETPTLIASTASPYKFANSIADAIGLDEEEGGTVDEFTVLKKLSEKTGIPIPPGLKDLETKPIRHKKTIEIDEMMEAVETSL